MSWGEGMAGTSRIEGFERNRHLRLVHEGEGPTKLEEPMVEEYFMESDGEITVLRLVQSGLPATADWDDFYEDTGRGWKIVLAGLRHYVERHFGQPCENIMFMQPVRIPVEEAWQKLLGPEGLAAEGDLANVETGDRKSITTAFGQKLEGEVLVLEPPHTLSMRIDNLEDSLLALDFERMGEQTFLYANLSTFGVPAEELEALKGQWRSWLDRLFPVPEEAPA